MTDQSLIRQEYARLAELQEFGVVDTAPEAVFDGIARIAARICDAPIAMVTFIDEKHQAIKARYGIELASTPRDESFCTHTIQSAVPMVIEDARQDARFAGIPLVTQAPNVRFYAGAPIRTESGHGLGAVCVLDTEPRQLLPFQIAALEALADDVSARLEARRSLAAMIESERLHRQLFAASPQVMWLIDAGTWQFLDVNEAAVNAYGWTREEFLAKTTHELWVPEDRAFKSERYALGLPAHLAPTLTRHRRRDGSVIVVEVTGHECMAEGRRAYLLILADVSERESAAAELLNANSKFEAAQRMAHVGNWEANLNTGDLMASDELHRLLGVPVGSLHHAAQLRSAIHPEDMPLTIAARELAEDPAIPMNIEHRIIRSDGTVRWVHTQAHVQLGETREGDRFLGTMQDITTRREAQQRLREQAELIELARDGIVVRDLDHTILAWNGGAERIFGWSADEVIGQNGRALLHSDPEAFDRAVDQVITTGHWSGELRKRTKAGHEVIVEGSWTLLRHENGTPRSILVINTDVTEKRKFEAQYLRAQRLESIGTLAGGIAHDLNNMLAPILMSIELLRELMPGTDAAEMLDTIQGSAQRGADLVKQVLTFARGVEGQREEMTVAATVREVARLARDTFPRGVEIATDYPPDLWWVKGDRTQLHQVLLNLVVNSRDAMPDGGLLTIAAKNLRLDEQYAAMSPGAKAMDYVLIQVSDTGLGITPAARERIFEPFFTTKAIGEGTGLGLATVQAIVRSHDGFVTVYSEVGKGTTFRVYLPGLWAREERAVETGPAALPRGNGETILVVDDESAIRDITRQTLEAFGYKVITATDGADALTMFARHGDVIDGILTDLMMPIMDGPALVQAVRRLDSKVPIIAASGLNANRTGAMFDVQEFLPKPYTAQTLLQALRAVLPAPGPER